jgi:hypothetical protein
MKSVWSISPLLNSRSRRQLGDAAQPREQVRDDGGMRRRVVAHLVGIGLETRPPRITGADRDLIVVGKRKPVPPDPFPDIPNL